MKIIDTLDLLAPPPGTVARRAPIDWEAQPLGEDFDRVLAAQLGVTTQTVRKNRKLRGVPAFKRRPDWDVQPLGRAPDPEIARAMGVSLQTVHAARRRRGIPLHQPEPPIERKCCGCSTVKPAAEFAAKAGSGQNWHGKCRPCRAADDAVYNAARAKHPEFRARVRAYDRTRYALHGFRSPGQRALREWIDGLKAKPCMDCGGRFPPEAMDFDHRDGATKKFTVSVAFAQALPRPAVEAEIAKCDLVCANCHRIRTKKRMEQVRAERRARAEAECR